MSKKNTSTLSTLLTREQQIPFKFANVEKLRLSEILSTAYYTFGEKRKTCGFKVKNKTLKYAYIKGMTGYCYFLYVKHSVNGV